MSVVSSSLATDPYASRVDAWETVPRVDPVVWGGGSGPLSREELRQFDGDGYRFVPELFDSEEISRFGAEADRLAAEADRRAEGVVTEPGSDVVRSLFRLHRTNEVFRELCRDPRLIDVARQILGSEVYVHQTRINYKPAFDGKEFFWHSDFETWHIEDGMPRMRAVSFSLFLTESTPFNGPLIVAPGSHVSYVRCEGATPERHYEQSLKRQRYGVPTQDALRELIDAGGLVAPTGPAGSAICFDCNLMHGSVGNLSPWPRTNFFVVYNSVENACTAPFGDRPPRPEYLAEREAVAVTPAR